MGGNSELRACRQVQRGAHRGDRDGVRGRTLSGDGTFQGGAGRDVTQVSSGEEEKFD